MAAHCASNCPTPPRDSPRFGEVPLPAVTPDLSDREFYQFSRLIHQHAGIQLSVQKKELVRARLTKILKARGVTSFADYYREVMADQSGLELVALLDAISTNQTSFWREAGHFIFLAQELLPGWRRQRRGPPAWKLWSAGCSSGEEPYTLAMTLLDTFPAEDLGKVRILASDLNTRVLAQARQGVYPLARLESLPGDWRRRYFQKGVQRWEGYARVKPEVRQMVEFFRLNFMEPFAFPEEFDVIFCRNVMIYFDRVHQEMLVNRFHHCLRPGGYFFIGHSESLCNIEHRFSYVKPTIYRK
ncbi:MAG: hypothetical protein FJ128_10845 [Deltaproteobacteria bacterium]|nr:hypothetical protein [Deltaproteobacteria bacterium]